MAEEAKKRPTLMTFNPDDIVGRGTFKNWIGRTDQDSYLELSDGTIIRSDKGIKLNTAEEVDQVNERAQEYIAKKNEEIQKQIDAYDAANVTKKVDDTKLITKDLDLKAVDDTAASIAATTATNDAFSEVAEQSAVTFGTGTDVTNVVQEESSFSNTELKSALDAAAVSASQAKAAMTFDGIVYDNVVDLQAAMLAGATSAAEKNAAKAGGSSSIINQPGSNTSTVNSGDALGQVSAAEQSYSSATASGGQMQKDVSISTGAAEDDAIDFYTKGTQSTILTTPTGLLNSDELAEDGTFRKRRGLIA